MNKISKGKAVGLLSLGLASVALGSVGFASWVVSTTSVTGGSNVSVTVAGVTDGRLTITAAADDANVTLDCKGKKAGNLGFTVGADSADEDLVFTVKVKITAAAAYASGAKNLKFEVAFPGRITTDNLLAVETVKDEQNANITDSYSTGFPVTPTAGSSLDKTYTFTLKWGSAFNGKNPVELNKDEGVTLENAQAGLATLKDALTGNDEAHKIKVTLFEVTA